METINDLLIEFDEMGLAPTTPCPDPEEYATEWREKVRAEFERLEAENAAQRKKLEKAVELPCKVGDIVYYLKTYCDYKGETVKHCSKRERPIMCECDEIIRRETSEEWLYVIREKPFELRDLTRIGKTLFLSREEAKSKREALRKKWERER